MGISLRNVAKTYDTASGRISAVSPVDLEIENGQFVSILGPSGCGKSTLLMMVAGIEPVTTGSIVIDGEELVRPHPASGLVFQDATLLPWLTVLENVLFPVRMMRLDDRGLKARALQLLTSVGLSAFANHRPRELSGGMRQRVALCRALIHSPSRLLMDEPFSALDAITRDAMGEVLLDLWDKARGASDMTAVFVTHSIREAVWLSDRVVVMGRSPSTVRADIAIPFPRPRNLEMQETAQFNTIVAQLRGYIDHSI